MRVAHLALELGLGRQGGDGVDDDQVDRPGAHEHLGDVERLLARVGLRDEKLVGLDTDATGVGDVERVLRVDEGGGAAVALCLGDCVEGKRGLAARFGTVDLDDAATRDPADAGGEIERQ